MISRITTLTLTEVLMPATTPGGSPGQLQFNNNGSFGGACPSLVASAGDLRVSGDADLIDWSDNSSAITLDNSAKVVRFPTTIFVEGVIRINTFTPSMTTLGNVIAKMPVSDTNGSVIGFLPIYDTIT